jgi:methionine synthase II (cobalamin-independent)
VRERIERISSRREPNTDCGLKALPRFCAFQKLKALSRAAARVREEIGAGKPVAAAA